MKTYPPIPRVDDAPDSLFERGHLWLQEMLDGAPFRFRLESTGALRFGDRSRVYDGDGVSLPYRHAARHVRERFDREALRAAVDDPADVVFFGVAIHRRTLDYDWDRTPSFLGHDVWSASGEQFLPPDVVEKVYRRLGLDPVNAFRKELRASDFHPERYEVPASDWYDGPAEGVVIRNKRGVRAAMLHPRFEEETDPSGRDGAVVPDATELARRHATDRRFEAVARELDARGVPVTFDAVYDRVVERAIRAGHADLFGGDVSSAPEERNARVDLRAFRSQVAARTDAFLSERDE